MASEDDEEDLEAQLTAEELEMARASGGEVSDAGPTTTASPANEEEEWDEDGGDAEDVEYEAMDDEEAWAAAAAASSDDGSPSSPPELADAADPADAAARDLALALAAAASSTKAGDVTVLHVAPLVYWTSYLVLATVYSRPQLSAVLAKAEAAAAAPPHNRDLSGSANPGRSSWEALDFGDVVLHVLTPAQREFYDIDGFYGAAAEVPLPEEGGSGGAGGKKEWARRL